jgi:hypothetical protein
MLVWGKQHWRRHRGWALFFLVATVAIIVGYLWRARGQERWPGGSSDVGLLFGTLGGLIILFEIALWPRRWPGVRAWRILGRTQSWLMAHIWLGLLTVPLIWFHSGFTWGGNLSTVLAVLFIVVIASGVYGLVLQQFLPKMMLTDVPGETIASQVEAVVSQYVRESDLLVESLCGREIMIKRFRALNNPMLPADPTTGKPEREDEETEHSLEQELGQIDAPYEGFMSTAQGRRAVSGLVLQNVPRDAELSTSQKRLVATAYVGTIRRFLKDGPTRRSPLYRKLRATEYFADLKGRVDAVAAEAVHALEMRCESRRGFQRQKTYTWLLHSWLAVHLPLSIALGVLMLLHIFVALKYW